MAPEAFASSCAVLSAYAQDTAYGDDPAGDWLYQAASCADNDS
jgi:hypothetical protein